MERRRLRASSRLNEYLDWPGVGQVRAVERVRRVKGVETTETALFVTSLTRAQAGPGRLLELIRAHWRVENGLHDVRDVTLGEDACRVRTGSAPQVLAGRRNAALTTLRAAGHDNIAAACRYMAAKAHEAVRLTTQTPLRLL